MQPITERALLTFVLSQVYKWSGVPKHINFNKYVKCLAMTRDKLYCGCSGYSIQVKLHMITKYHTMSMLHDIYKSFIYHLEK